MICINDQCSSPDTKIIETTKSPMATYRRRCCMVCNTRYTTTETYSKDGTVPKRTKKLGMPK